MRVFALLLLCGAMISPAGAASFEQGLRAFRLGDYAQALEQWQPLADAGDSDAQHAIGSMYEYGRGLTLSDTQAAIWFRRAAEQDMPEAQYRLGVFYENGWGVVPDAVQAARWYRRAAELGHAFAQHDLAYMHLNGEGVEPDKVRAYMWLKIASLKRGSVMIKHLHHVSQMLTPDEIRQAEQLAGDWLRAHN